MRFPRPDRIAPFRVVRTGSEMASGRPCRPMVETGSGLFVGAIEAGRQHVSEQQYKYKMRMTLPLCAGFAERANVMTRARSQLCPGLLLLMCGGGLPLVPPRHPPG